MDYKLYTGIWEVTMACNMRCLHCGSSCKDKLPDELTTEEALKICDELGELGVKYITLSGGEPTTRKDLPLLVKRLRENNVIPNMITNGWILTEDLIQELVNSGIGTIAISIDGLSETHDFIRREGSFARSMQAFDILHEYQVWTAAITTVNKKNIEELSALKDVLVDHYVNSWQIQIGLPMGNLLENNHLVAEPSDVKKVVDFAYENMHDDRISITFGDCIGYYDFKSTQVMRKAKGDESYIWSGCGAGKASIGILHNGDIVGCTSIRDKEYIEGNIRDKSLKKIWTDENSFLWNRSFKKDDLSGFCGKCRYGDLCLGGCSNTRLCMEGNLYQSNRYCLYYMAISKEKDNLKQYTDVNNLYLSAEQLINKRQFQLAQIILERALELDENNIKVLSTYGYVNYMLKNYPLAKQINEKILELDNNNIYAYKGLGLTLNKLGNVPLALKYLYKAISLCDENYMLPYYDCAVTLIENNKRNEAIKVLEEAKAKSLRFFIEHNEIYELLGIA
ncbi:MAG TPA: radical SAM protein [Haloplasmataceae bacterium]